MNNARQLPLDGDVIVLRGGGDLATGVAQKLVHAGFRLVILETHCPTVIRRTVSLAVAAFDGEAAVEDIRCRRVETEGLAACWAEGVVPLLIDPDCASLPRIRPAGLVDAIIAKRNLGVSRSMAPVTIALGPGFSAPEDVDCVIETMRGHNLGRLIWQGSALPNTGTPGLIAGRSAERVIHAPVAGAVRHVKSIGDRVRAGEPVFFIDDTPVPAPIDGVLRGLIAEGLSVPAGMKSADVDPRLDVDCTTISDKARALGGAVLEAYLLLQRRLRAGENPAPHHFTPEPQGRGEPAPARRPR